MFKGVIMPILSRKESITSLRKQLVDTLLDLEKKDPEITGSVIVRTDGLVIASAIRENIDKDLVAAMSASILQVGKRVLEELKRGELENVIIRGKDGIMMVISINPEVYLVSMASKNANLGLMLIEMRRAAEKIDKTLST